MRLEAQVREQLGRASVLWNASEIVLAEGRKGYRLRVSVRLV